MRIEAESTLGSVCARVVAAIGIFAFLFSLLYQLDARAFLGEFGRKDLIAFWAGASLFLRGANPYSPEELERFYAGLSFEPMYHQIFWNPPWCLTTLGWFGLISFHTLVLAWLAVGISAVSAALLLMKSAIQPERSNFSFFLQLTVILSFYPLAFCLGMGQLSAFLLLITVMLGIALQRRTPRDFWIGAATSLLLLKPHLFHLVLLIAAWEILSQRRLQIVLGFVIAALLQLLLPLLWMPQIYTFYSSSQVPTFWFNSSLGALMQSFSPEETWRRFIPMVVFDVALLLAWPRIRQKVSLMKAFWLLVMPLSLLSAPYAWLYDFVLLIPALQILIITAFSESRTHGVVMVVLLLIQNAALGFGPEEMQYYTWVPAVVMMLGLSVILRTVFPEA